MADSGSGMGLGLDSGPSPTQSRSFTEYSTRTMADIAARVVGQFADEKDDYYEDVGLDETIPGDETEEELGAGGGSDFEFEFVVPSGEENSSPISAGEIFSNGQIKPLFPVFNSDWRSNFHLDGVSGASEQEESCNSSEISSIRLPLWKLLHTERESSLTALASCSSSEADDREGANPGTYSLWTQPKQDISKKSKSTGSSMRWRLRNLVHRSHSDGSDNFIFAAPEQEEEQRNGRSSASSTKPVVPTLKAVERSKDSEAPSTSAAVVGNAHRQHYLRNRTMRENDRKKSYLPYKQDLVGFFTNVNGFNRTIHPF